MSVIYRTSDIVDLKVDKLTVGVKPLNYKVKADMQSSIMAGKPMDAAVTALKYSLAYTKGLKLPDGSDYELKFDESGAVSDECIDDLLNVPEGVKLNIIAITLINGMPQGEFTDPQSGKKLAGVKILKGESSGKK